VIITVAMFVCIVHICIKFVLVITVNAINCVYSVLYHIVLHKKCKILAQ